MEIPPKSRRKAKEMWVAIPLAVVLMALAAFFWNDWSTNRRKAAVADILSRMKSLSLAAQTMALDGQTTGDTNLRWPGDGAGTFSDWVAKLVPVYLSTNDFLRIMSPPGVTLTNMPTKNDGFIRVYAVTEDSPPDAVLFATANVKVAPDGKISLDPAVKPLGDKGFLIFRKGGDGAVLQSGQANGMNLAGKVPALLRD